jgi:hypothetical protein
VRRLKADEVVVVVRDNKDEGKDEVGTVVLGDEEGLELDGIELDGQEDEGTDDVGFEDEGELLDGFELDGIDDVGH